MKKVDPLLLLKHYLGQGYDMAYVDSNKERRAIAKEMGGKEIFVEDYRFVGYSTHHRDITIFVNPVEDDMTYRELLMVSNSNIIVNTCLEEK